MSGATLTTASAAIAKHFLPAIQKTFYNGIPILNHYGVSERHGSASIDVLFHSAGNSSAQTYSEGDAAPLAGYQTIVAGTLAPASYQAVVRISGHLRDAIGSGDRYYDAVGVELQKGVEDLMHKVEEGLAADYIDAIDDDTTYMGLTRATYGLSSSVTDASSARLTNAMLETAWKNVSIDGRVVDKSDFEIVSTAEQAAIYGRISSDLGGIYVSRTLGDGALDSGRLQSGLSYNGAPWIVLPTITNSYVFGTRKSDIKIRETRTVTVEPLAKVDDSDALLLTWRGRLIHQNPCMTFRIESLATS